MSVTRLVPRLVVTDADAAIAFYQRVFGAELGVAHRMQDGSIVHAELRLGDHAIFLKDADEVDRDGNAIGSTPVLLALYTDEVDALWARCIQAGAEIVYDLATQFYGERGGRIRDPFGQVWMLSQIVEEVSDEEMARRIAAYEG